MRNLDDLLWRVLLFLAEPPRRDERGDVPGWVLVTVMTAALVTAILAIARTRLSQLLQDALSGIGG